MNLVLKRTTLFENYVNYAGSKTTVQSNIALNGFENYVNYAGSKTVVKLRKVSQSFENYVNYAGSKTSPLLIGFPLSLRTM